jgi:hypothetical protein
MDGQGRQRAFLRKAINTHIGILKRGDRADGYLTPMEIVPGADERAPI